MKTFIEIYEWISKRMRNPSPNDLQEFCKSLNIPFTKSANLNKYHPTYFITCSPIDGNQPLQISFVDGEANGCTLGYPEMVYEE